MTKQCHATPWHTFTEITEYEITGKVMSEESPNYCLVDDKHVPLYRVLWISDTPHFCGEEDCMHEGDYEIRLEQGECVWASRPERDHAIEALDMWMTGPEPPDGL